MFHPAVREWFDASFDAPTQAQTLGWPSILAGKSTLLLAPTGSGKTLAAFLAAIERLMFTPEPAKKERLRVLYVSPLKALGVDVEKNLRAPLAGIAAHAQRRGDEYRVPVIGVRSGDTPAKERARFNREPADILITTPESLYLLLTSAARDVLRSVETVIVDEIHSMVASKRGAHLFLSLERLEVLCGRPLQRIGLSATQRPLSEIARLLAGGEVAEDAWTQRPVEIVDAGSRRAIDLRIEVPVEDMANLGEPELVSGPAASAQQRRSIWPSIHPRLVELVRQHRSTMIFANSRRLAERIAAAMNELAGEEIALAHHGSVAKDQRLAIEDRLKRGTLPAIVATSSLELGIDMGAVDLVIQIEAPPSVASGMQRVGRAGHGVGELPKGVVFPKFRGDLLAAAATAERMLAGQVEETLYPRNPLDVLAQQIVAAVAMEEWPVEELFKLVRRAASFAELPRASFEGVLDMLSGRYPSDEFAGLRARVTWDRVAGTARARQGARSIAVINGGTIPDRGLYGVFLAGAEEGKPVRVGELDEEMVFESREGEVFVLGASAWRIDEITHDQVRVTPAPGESGKLPFWHGDRPGRPAELGAAVGKLAREIADDAPDHARERLRETNKLDPLAADNLIAFVRDQREATGEVPSDRAIVIERFIDEMGDWRVCVLSPFGARVHAPWATATTQQIREQTGLEVEVIWSDDGMVYRLPETDAAPDPSLFVPTPESVEDQVVRSLGGTSLFAARFRENAARALLLPRRFPGKRTALWAQRKRAGDLLAVASRYASFPILLETYRECLRDVFDVPALVDILRRVQAQQIRIVVADTHVPSPFAGTLLFSYVANFIYDGDAPLAERRAQALGIDQAQLRELLGSAELRELFDPGAIESLEKSLARLDHPVKSADGLHDLLLALGDLSLAELGDRAGPATREWIDLLVKERRAIQVRIAGEERFIATEDVGRYRDALGIVPPRGLPAAFLESVDDALGDLVSRYARTHVPFLADDVALRFGIGVGPVRTALERLMLRDRVVEGEFLPGGHGREWCDVEVLRALKRRSLARLRQQIEPVDQAAYARFLLEWQNVARPLAGADALITAIEQLEGAPIVLSDLETDILPARVRGYRPSDLDLLLATGEVCWRGAEPLGQNDGRVAFYLADRYSLLAPSPAPVEGELAARVHDLLATRGALFFHDLVAHTGAFAADVATALHALMWAGEITNDTLAPLRSLLVGGAKHERRNPRHRGRRVALPGTEGRWSLLRSSDPRSDTERRAALAGVLLDRYGVLVREATHAEGVVGGFSAVYPVLKAMEDAGKLRRGWFVAGLGATQFARPGADDRLRALRDASENARTLVIASTDPANPYGAALPWPSGSGDARPMRAAGARVVLHDGVLVGWLARGEQSLLVFLPTDEPEHGNAARGLAAALAQLVESGQRRALLLTRVDGGDPVHSPIAPFLLEAGFSPGSRGWLKRGGTTARARDGERARG